MHLVNKRNVKCLVATISDTRTVETDKSGLLIKKFLLQNGHECVEHVIVRDEKEEIEKVITNGINDEQVEAILLTGGTGISARDVTIEVVEQLIEKEIINHITMQEVNGTTIEESMRTALLCAEILD